MNLNALYGEEGILIAKEETITIPTAVYNEVVITGKEKNYAESYIIEKYIKESKILVNKFFY